MFKTRFGKRKSGFPSQSTLSKPRLQQYIDQQHTYNNMYNREDDETYKLQYKPAIRNSKDLYDMLFPSRRENDNTNHHQLIAADIGLDSN